jgi:hypothetical protein
VLLIDVSLCVVFSNSESSLRTIDTPVTVVRTVELRYTLGWHAMCSFVAKPVPSFCASKVTALHASALVRPRVSLFVASTMNQSMIREPRLRYLRE